MTEEKYFIQKMNGVLLFGHLAAEAQIKTLRKYYPEEGYEVFHNINTNKINYFTYEWSKLHNLGEHILKKLEKEPEFLNHAMEVWREKEQDLINYMEKLKTEDYSEYSNAELLDTLNKLFFLYQEECAYPMLCDAFGLHSEGILIEKLKEILKRRGEEKKLAKYLSILIAPVYETFTTRKEKSLMKVIVEIEKNPELREQIKNGNFEIKDEKINKLLENHTENFFWITNGYHQGIKVDKNYFLEQIQEFFKEKLDATKRLEGLENQNKFHKQQKKELMIELDADVNFRNFIDWIEKFTLMHDERKSYVLQVNYYVNEIIKEISKRTKVSVEDLHMCFHFEVKDILEGKFNKEEIEKRKKLCYWVVKDSGFECVTGEEAQKWEKELLEEKEHEKIHEFRGTPASPGVTAGRIKIIAELSEFPKLEKGDILVTGMTRPEYVTIMKKAAAIVTDEGGITCHAAIVSRELGIPCVIGTQKATRVLKDNMLVEVNGNHGTIKIL